MKLCGGCVAKRTLCKDCRSKLASGELTQVEIDVERALFKLSKKNPVISEAQVVKTIDAGSVLIITGRGSSKKLIGPSGKTVREIAAQLKRHVRIMEEPRNSRDLLNKLIGSSSILGVNILYTPEGETFRVRVNKAYKNRLPLQPETFSSVAKELLGKNMEIVFE